MPGKRPDWSTLDGVLDEIWRMLARGASSFRDPFHQAVVATVDSCGPGARMMILRKFDVRERRLVCHTDVRSEKVRQLTAEPRMSWFFYHPRRKVQVRVCGQATLHTDDDFADSEWAGLRVSNRINYATSGAPGSPMDGPSTGIPNSILKKLPAMVDDGRFREYFCAVSCRIQTVDWLKLGVLGHRRARFDWVADEMTSTWLVP